MDEGGDNEDSDKGLDYRSILKLNLIEFTNGLFLGYKKEKSQRQLG